MNRMLRAVLIGLLVAALLWLTKVLGLQRWG
jgi:hypothetical protein